MSDKLKGQVSRWSPAIGSKGQSGGPWRGTQNHVADAPRGIIGMHAGDSAKNYTGNERLMGGRAPEVRRSFAVPHETHGMQSSVGHPKRAMRDPASFKKPPKQKFKPRRTNISSR